MSQKTVALVTGGSRGIGAAVCRELAKQGLHVVVNYSSSPAKADEVMNSILSLGGSASVMGFDVSHSSQVDESVEKINKEWGTIEVLVNNAGVAIDGLLMRMKDEDLEKTLNIDLKGAIYCSRACMRGMMKARKGSIIHISSVIGTMGNAGQCAYAAAKSGLIGFSKSLAREVASRSIRSNVITPGFITTDMTGALTESQKESILQSIPLGLLGSPQDIADSVAFLASDKSRYITGQVIGVNGGMYM